MQVEVPLTTSKVEETLTAIQGRKEYYLKKRQSVKDGTYDAEKDPEVHSKKSATSNGVASSSHSPAANGDVTEEFEHVGTPLSVNQSVNQSSLSVWAHLCACLVMSACRLHAALFCCQAKACIPFSC